MTKDLIEYCDKNGIEYRVLTAEEKADINALIAERYVDKNSKGGRTLFDRLKIYESVAVNDSDSWRWLLPFFRGRKTVVFKSSDEDSFAELLDGGSFFGFYDNYAAVEFYLADPCGEYLCGYNHSHCVFAMGTAADWLENTQEYRQYYG